MDGTCASIPVRPALRMALHAGDKADVVLAGDEPRNILSIRRTAAPLYNAYYSIVGDVLFVQVGDVELRLECDPARLRDLQRALNDAAMKIGDTLDARDDGVKLALSGVELEAPIAAEGGAV